MGTAAKRTRENRTITVDFRDESTYFELLSDGKAFVECVLAFLLTLGFQLLHKATCRGGRGLTRHSHYARVRLGGLTIWRVQCTTCQAVFTVLPHFVLRYRQMRPDVARDALLATHGGLSLEWCAVICNLSPMALYRLVCALGQQSLVAVLTRRKLPLHQCISWPMKSTATVSRARCICPPSSAAVCSGIWGTVSPRVPPPLPRPMATFNTRPFRLSRRTRYRAPSPMALTAPPAVCGRCFQELAWAIACATPSISCRANWWACRLQCARGCVRSSTEA